MSIEAMKQALEALERGRPQIVGALVQQDQDIAITSLRQAIEQAEKQEPVAWIVHAKHPYVTMDAPLLDEKGLPRTPLYIAQYKRNPMTLSVVREKARLHVQEGRSYRGHWDNITERMFQICENYFVAGFRSAETAHGIKGEA